MDNQYPLPPVSKKPIFVALLVTLVTLVSTLVAGYITEQAVNARLQDFFNRQADQIANTYYNKLHTHITILEGLRGLWNTSGTFTYHSFTKYVESLDLSSIDKTGVSSYFYAPAIRRDELTSFITKVKQEPNIPATYQTLTIHPKSESEYYYPAIYAVPLKGREGSIGLDFSTFPERVDAINYARDHKTLATTNSVILLTTGKSGFFFLLPLYYKSSSLERTPERQAAFAGVVGAAFRSESAFDQIFGSDNPYPYLSFHIYQGDDTSEDRLLYDSDPSFNHAQPRFTATRKISLKDQRWTIVVESKPNFTLIDYEQKLPLVVFTIGLVMTFLLGGYSITQFSKIRQAH